MVVIPILLLGGMVVGPVGLVVTAIATIFFLQKGRHDSLILLFVLILVLGDSRMVNLQFIKPLRIELMVILSVYAIWEMRTGAYQFSKYFLYFLPFLLVAFLGLIFSPILGLAISKTISFALLYFVCLHYLHHKFKVYGMRLLVDIMYLAHVIIFLGLLFLPIFPMLVSYGGIRFNGMLGNPNGLGVFIVLITPLTVYVFRKQPSIMQRYRTLAWMAIYLSLALCSSRNAILSVSVFWIVLSGINGTSFRTLIFLFVLLPMTMILIYNIDLESVVIALGLEKYLRLRDLESGSGRVYAWQHALEFVEQNPLIGCGFACEEYNFVYRTSYRLWVTGHQGGVHNSYLAFLMNTGFVGLALFLGFVASLVVKMGERKFYIPFVISLAISAMFESWMFSSLNAFHIFFLITVIWCMVDARQHDLIAARLDTEHRDNLSPIAYIR